MSITSQPYIYGKGMIMTGKGLIMNEKSGTGGKGRISGNIPW
jgi:hypothetical protein